MQIIYLLLFLLAAILFLLAMIGVPSSPRFNLLAGGLLAWVLVYVIKTALGFHGG